MVLHALLEHRVLPSLADDQVSPLDDNDGDKESSVAGELQDLSVGVGPLLPIGVFQVIHCLGIPGSSQTEEFAWPKTVLTEDDKVDKESC